MRAHLSIALLIGAIVPRIAAWWLLPAAEPNYYYWLANGILDQQVFSFGDEPTSFIEPGYPVALAFLRAIAGSDRGALLLQALISATGAVAIGRLASRLAGRELAGVAAAAFYAFDPYFVRQSVAYLEIPIVLPLLLWAFERLSAVRSSRSAAVAGLLFGLLLLTRSSFLPACAALALLAAARNLRHACAAVLAAGIIVAPWTIRSYAANGTLLPTRAGENLFLSTSEYAVGFLPEHDIDLLVRFGQFAVDDALRSSGAAHSERVADEILLARARAFVVQHLWLTLQLKLRNLVWIPSPLLLPRFAKSDSAHAAMIDGRVQTIGEQRRPRFWEVSHALARVVLTAAALLGLVRRRGLRDADLLAVLLSEIVVYTVFFPTTRLLAPMTAVLMVYAGFGLSSLKTGARSIV